MSESKSEMDEAAEIYFYRKPKWARKQQARAFKAGWTSRANASDVRELVETLEAIAANADDLELDWQEIALSRRSMAREALAIWRKANGGKG